MRIISLDHVDYETDDTATLAMIYEALRETRGMSREQAFNWLGELGARNLAALLPAKAMDWIDWTMFGATKVPDVDGPEPEHASVEAIEAAMAAGEAARDAAVRDLTGSSSQGTSS